MIKEEEVDRAEERAEPEATRKKSEREENVAEKME